MLPYHRCRRDGVEPASGESLISKVDANQLKGPYQLFVVRPSAFDLQFLGEMAESNVGQPDERQPLPLSPVSDVDSRVGLNVPNLRRLHPRHSTTGVTCSGSRARIHSSELVWSLAARLLCPSRGLPTASVLPSGGRVDLRGVGGAGGLPPRGSYLRGAAAAP